MPFGPQGIPADLFDDYTGTFLSLSPGNAISLLNSARAAGIRLTIQLAGGRPAYQTSSGAFSISGFRAALDRWAAINLQPYIDDGTIMGHMLFDEPHDGSNWNGQIVPLSDVKAAADYSKQLWPDMPVGLGTNACYLVALPHYLIESIDFVSTSFTVRRLDSINACNQTYSTAEDWLEGQVQGTEELGIRLVISINPLAATERDANMSAANLEAWGSLFAAEPSLCLLTMWRHEPPDGDGDGVTYWTLPGVAQAVQAIAAVAAGRTATGCGEPTGPAAPIGP